MWIARSSKWHSETTPLQKFAVERILQRCDYSELITNRFRTMNGFTLLKEMIHYCNVTMRRSKTVKTLMVTVEEAKSPLINQNIVNDLIICEYFKDLKEYLEKNVDSKKLVGEKMQPNLLFLENLQKDLRVFEKQLEKHYFEFLSKELIAIPFGEKKEVHRYIGKLANLIDLLIPYLIFKGYSSATISQILQGWLKSGYPITIVKFLSFLHYKERPFTFLQFLGKKSEESHDFLDLMRKSLDVEINNISSKELDKSFVATHSISDDVEFAKYVYNTIDPHMHVRSNFDALLKRLVVQKDRRSLSVFNDFFTHSFWSNKKDQPITKFRTISLEGDPINVLSREKTLRNTLYKASKIYDYEYLESDHIPLVDCEQLRNSIYYYNLALGSKSIENSLSLLWTSLEAVQPYKVYNADIDAVQKIISKGLGFGAIGRDIYGFAIRVNSINKLNEDCFENGFEIPLPQNTYPDKLNDWFNWIKDEKNCKKNFEKFKEHSELLAFQYHSLGKKYTEENLNLILDRINKSEASIRFQLQRIYHHRNKIVHSGDMINEYTNLWMHLEWYVGKILSYFIIKLHFKQESRSLEDAFMELEADRDYLISYLERNKEMKIKDLPDRILSLMFKNGWHFF
ncbi:hypothetical protein DN752_13240 [Echinicola strongylocentroti]|uniref:Apea-like HEPN domain-containing protein n=1 Tax=Echinicola strongylocentroti TaxID=1795355 RepID=A0A2Z4IJY8_9BACT|nr:hypothetical protein [Echinicola strongylocentroti]AWW31009.1 hypothetical protein DN752_13240 [Echinicola strongylocentroti]